MKTLNQFACIIGWVTIVLFGLGALNMGEFTYQFASVKEETK